MVSLLHVISENGLAAFMMQNVPLYTMCVGTGVELAMKYVRSRARAA